MPDTVFADSPRNGAWGDRPYAILDHAGPASYTQVTTGTPPTGGDPVTPATFGLTCPLEGIFMVGASTNGQYGVVAIQTTAYSKGAGNATWTLLWYTLATGAQAAATTNLSAQQVRLIAFGPH